MLAALPSTQSQAWVSEALTTGTAQEQLAALQSLAVFPVQQKEGMLLQLLHDAKTSQDVRLLVIDNLAESKTPRVLRELRTLAMRDEPAEATPPRDPAQAKAEAQVTAQAMLDLQQWGQLMDKNSRKYLRMRIDDKEWNEDVVIAARASLLQYALEAKPGK